MKNIISLLLGVSVLFTLGCQRKSNKIIAKKLAQYRVTAIQNNCLEKVKDETILAYFKHQVGYPYWKNAKKLHERHKRFTRVANRTFRNDKNRHCMAGYLIAKELGYKTAVFAAYAKEAKDVGDANRNTHFEIADKRATIYGARLALKRQRPSLCSRAKVKFKFKKTNCRGRQITVRDLAQIDAEERRKNRRCGRDGCFDANRFRREQDGK